MCYASKTFIYFVVAANASGEQLTKNLWKPLSKARRAITTTLITLDCTVTAKAKIIPYNLKLLVYCVLRTIGELLGSVGNIKNLTLFILPTTSAVDSEL